VQPLLRFVVQPLLRFVMMIALSIVSMTAFAQARDSEGAARRVVILNAADPYLPAFLALDRSLREAITRAEHGAPTEFYAETLDMLHPPNSMLKHSICSVFRRRCSRKI